MYANKTTNIYEPSADMVAFRIKWEIIEHLIHALTIFSGKFLKYFICAFIIPMTYKVDDDAMSRRNKDVIINQRISITVYLKLLLYPFVRCGPFSCNKIYCIRFDFMSFCSLSFKYIRRCNIHTLVMYWRPTQSVLFSRHNATSKHDLYGLYTHSGETRSWCLGNMSNISIQWVSIPVCC